MGKVQDRSHSIRRYRSAVKALYTVFKLCTICVVIRMVLATKEVKNENFSKLSCSIFRSFSEFDSPNSIPGISD